MGGPPATGVSGSVSSVKPNGSSKAGLGIASAKGASSVGGEAGGRGAGSRSPPGAAGSAGPGAEASDAAGATATAERVEKRGASSKATT